MDLSGIVFIVGSSLVWIVGGQRIINQQKRKEYLNAHDPLNGDFNRNPRFPINSWTQREAKDLRTITDGTDALFGEEFRAKHNEMLLKAKVNNPIPLLSPYHGAGVNQTPGWQSHLHGYETDAFEPKEWIGQKRFDREKHLPVNVII